MACRARRAAAPVRSRRRLGPVPAPGHGDRQLRRHRRRLSRRVPDEPGAERAPDADRGPVPADLPRHRAQARGRTRPGRSPAATRCRRPPGTRSSRTSTTTASSTCSSPRATSTRSPTTPPRTQPTCSSASPTGRSSREPMRPASSPSPAAGARRSPTSTSTGCSTWSRSTSATRSRLWRNVGVGRRREAGPDGPLAGPPASASPDPNRDAIGAWVEVKVGDATLRRELTVGGGHVGGQLGWIHFGLGPADRRPGPRPVARRRDGAVDARDRRPVRDHRAGRQRGAPLAAAQGLRGGIGRMAKARLAEIEPARLRDAGDPTGAPGVALPGRLARLRERAGGRGYDRLVVYADREHSANLAYLTGFDPRFEEALLVVGAGGRPGDPGRQRVPRAGRRGTAADAPGAVPGPQPAGQPRDRSRPLDEILAGEGIGPGSRVGVVGWKTYARPRDDRGAGLHRRRAAPPDRAERAGRERDRPAHRRGRRAAGDQRGRAARRLRVRRLPDLERASGGSCSGCGRG